MIKTHKLNLIDYQILKKDLSTENVHTDEFRHLSINISKL
jgi:hypothetical protein